MIAQRKRELEKKANDLEIERVRILEAKREKEEELNEVKMLTETVTQDIDRLVPETREKKAEVEEKEVHVRNQEMAIADARVKIDKLKKKKRFIWCG